MAGYVMKTSIYKFILRGKLTTIRIVIDTAYICRKGSKDKETQHLT